MKKYILITLLSVFLLALSACGKEVTASSAAVSDSLTVSSAGLAAGSQTTTPVVVTPIAVTYDQEDLVETDLDSAEATIILLQGDVVSVDGGGAVADNSIVTIQSAGTYEISGKLNDGQIIVDTTDPESVTLMLSGVDISSSSSSPIYVSNAEKVILTLSAYTQNTVTDEGSYIFATGEDEPDAAIFSHDDLTINGSGSLTVNANFNNGIVSKDDLKITGGNITVYAVNDGIKGRDSLNIKDGVIIVDAGGDGLQANNDEDPEQGYIVIEGGSLDITTGLDGIQAETMLSISGGEIALVTGGGSTVYAPADSAKGLKAGVDITISGGVFGIDSAADAIHSNDTITILGGEYQIATGDDAIHADTQLTISGGDMDIAKSYEGIESQSIVIDDGTIRVVASDDGINGSDGGGGSAMGQGPGGFETGDSSITINGGYITLDTGGDGIDVNGVLSMTGGVLLVHGPVTDREGALDYNVNFQMSGGYLVAVGSAGMAQAPSSDSSQYAVMYNFASVQQAGTLIQLVNADGDELLTFAPTKDFQSLVFSSPDLQNGDTLVIYTDGNQTASLTLDGTLTTGGVVGGGFGAPGGGVRPPRP